jgi:hypothetical protein
MTATAIADSLVGHDMLCTFLPRCDEDTVSLHEDQTDCSSLRYDLPLLGPYL